MPLQIRQRGSSQRRSSDCNLHGRFDHRGMEPRRCVVVDRGISGQTSPQMLVRFYQDVVALHPLAVHIMAGTNDVAGNTGPSSPDDFKNNIRAMVDLATANHIRVVLASILPAERFSWRPEIQPVEQIRQLNSWLLQFTVQHHLIYADYYSSLTTSSSAFRPELSNDGVHPNSAG